MWFSYWIAYFLFLTTLDSLSHAWMCILEGLCFLLCSSFFHLKILNLCSRAQKSIPHEDVCIYSPWGILVSSVVSSKAPLCTLSLHAIPLKFTSGWLWHKIKIPRSWQLPQMSPSPHTPGFLTVVSISMDQMSCFAGWFMVALGKTPQRV